jgi:hypothetical protein
VIAIIEYDLPMQATPILILAFSRTHSVVNLLNVLDKCSGREVLISFDGLTNTEPTLVEKSTRTLKVVEDWAKSSIHTVNIVRQKENMGCNGHNKLAIQLAAEKFTKFLHFEDDVEFRPELVNYLDEFLPEILDKGFWGVCGNNPSPKSDLKYYDFLSKISFAKYTNWSNFGWATSSENALALLESIGKPIDSRTREELFKRVSKNTTRDPALRKSIENFWIAKTERAFATYPDWENRTKRQFAVSWDSWAVLHVWLSGQEIIKPSFSLSREGHFQFEAQEHPHSFPETSWDEYENRTVHISKSQFYNLASDQADGLVEWNITRKKSWQRFLLS